MGKRESIVGTETSGGAQSGHDPEPCEERGEGKREGRERETSEEPPKRMGKRNGRSI